MPRVQVAKNPVKTQLACTSYSCGFCCRFGRLYFIDRDRDQYIFGSQVSLTFISAFYHLSNLFRFCLFFFFTFLEEISLGVNYALHCAKNKGRFYVHNSCHFWTFLVGGLVSCHFHQHFYSTGFKKNCQLASPFSLSFLLSNCLTLIVMRNDS